MCGICGAIGSPELTGPVRDMIPLMYRRGPDDEGHWTDGGRCSLGFRRLSILDLSPAGHQPMLSRDGRYALVFNGEVYNFRELRDELIAQGASFRSSGDSEVVLQSLAHWGKNALARFNGMFAIAFYDREAGTLLLARDFAGIKPLYYMTAPQGLVFASQYDQLLAHPHSRTLKVSEGGLGLYLRLGYIPAPYGLLQDTHMLEPGAWLSVAADGRISQGRFFQFPVSPETDLSGSDAVDAIDAAITNAVRRQLVSDVPVGTFLSGGIDSPLVTAKAAQLTGGSLKAFTIGTAGDKHDESTDAAAYAAEIGVPHIIEHISPQTSLELLEDVVDACGEPFGDFSIFPTMLVSRLARREVKVMLSGDGGDELFWGYAKRFPGLISRSGDFKQPLLLRQARWGAKRFLGLGKADYNLCFPSIGRWVREKHSHLHEDGLTGIFVQSPAWPESFGHYDFSGHDADSTANWLRWNEFTGRMNMILQKVDRASMHESLEVRVPLLDKEVVETAMRVDWRSCLDLQSRTGKLPLRTILGRHVKHHTQAKRGFTVPMDDWLRGPLKASFQDLVVNREDLLGYPLNRPGIRKTFDRFVAGQKHDAWGMWLLLNLSLWSDRHFKKG